MKYDLVAKLQKKKQGRLDDLKTAVESGDIHQPGLMQAVIDSLEDGDPYLVSYIAKSVLPLYGRAAVPSLAKAFNPGGRIADACRLAAIRRFDAVKARGLARQALNASHKDLAAEAIRTLQGSKKDTLLILEQTKRRSADIRREAFSALAGVVDKRVVAEVSAAFAHGVAEASNAIRMTPHPAYEDVCVKMLRSLEHKAGEGAGLKPDEQLLLTAVFRACEGQGGEALDQGLTAWVQRAIDGGLQKGLYGHGNVCSLIESVALSKSPAAQRLLVENRERFDLPNMAAILCAASWHESFDLVELFAPYVPRFKSRCYGWFCECGGDWPCSVLSAVEFALDVDFDAPGYEGRKPYGAQVALIQKIRKDPRWKVARRT